MLSGFPARAGRQAVQLLEQAARIGRTAAIVSRIEAAACAPGAAVYGIPRMIERYGPATRMTELKNLIAEDGPRQESGIHLTHSKRQGMAT